MAESEKERTTLRRKVTTRYNLLKNSIDSLGIDDVKIDLTLFKDYLTRLKELDRVIMDKLLSDSSVSQENIYDLDSKCEEYYRKIHFIINKLNFKANSNTNDNTQENKRSKIHLPKLQLPEFSADSTLDKFVCKRFFEVFEHLISQYNLNEIEKFNLLEQQCRGRAKVMISSINVVQQTYNQAKQILIDAFAEELPQKFVLVKELTDLKFVWGKDDPYIFYANFKKLIDSVNDNNVDLNTVILYFIWSALPVKFQDILVAITNKSYPDLDELRSKFLEACSRYNTQIDKNCKLNTAVLATSLNTTTKNDFNCILCSSTDHKISNCSKYSEVNDKVKRLKELKRCFKCLKTGHFSKNCKFQTSGLCTKCKKGKHWSFLCNIVKSKTNDNDNIKVVKSDDNKATNKTDSVIVASSQSEYFDSLLPLLSVETCVNDLNVNISTVLDSCSQSSFIESDLADKLNLEVYCSNIDLVIKGMNSCKQVNTKSVVLPFNMGGKKFQINCICIPRINIEMKVCGIGKLIDLMSLNGKSFAYKDFDRSKESNVISDIKLLIGSKDWHIVANLECGSIGPDYRLTTFYKLNEKYILMGSVNDWILNLSNDSDEVNLSDSRVGLNNIVSHSFVSTLDRLEISDIETPVISNISNVENISDILDIASYSQLDENCRIFINMENESPIEEVNMVTEQEVTDFIINNTTKEDGQFVMPIPWFSRYKDLVGHNEKLAYKILMSVKNKYIKTDVLSRIDEVFKSQIDSDIIERVTDFSDFKKRFPSYSFISHSPVIKEDRDTTKVRVIYMANLAEKKPDGSKGISLNQSIHPGFNKNFKISDALTMIRFDKYLYGFDISKAFHRLCISDENSSKFLFYWFKDIDGGDYTPVVYRSKKVIFGMSVSPYLLQCSLYKMLVIDSDSTDSRELKDLKNRIYQGSYVDNFFVGCNSETEVREIYSKSLDIFNSNRFPLQQFITNYNDFQNDLDRLYKTDTPAEVKVLGMRWDRINDILKSPKVNLNVEARTSRQILSSSMSVFDLNNANLPLLNRCKIFLRQLQSGCKKDWDKEIKPAQLNEWKNISIQFNNGDMMEVPRFVGNRDSTYDIITMTDASKDFVGCVIYLKEVTTGLVSFISAHNKILDNTLRGRTMPVLELTSIEYGVQKALDLFRMFTSCIVPIQVRNVLFFTDSTIALSWLKDSENLRNKVQKRSIYVNNRIKNIVELCKSTCNVKISHIGTNSNSADFTTRVVSYKKLKNSCFISGPEILKTDLSTCEWLVIPNPNVNNQVEGPDIIVNTVSVEEVSLDKVIDLTKFSSLNRAIKILSRVKQFINRIKERLSIKCSKHDHSIIIDSSYASCSNDLLKFDQRKYLSEVSLFFDSKRKTKRSIPDLVTKMNVFSESGILRIRSKMGKLTKGIISKTPILLSSDSQFGKLLVADMHKKYNHSGAYYLLHKIKPIYFILKAFSTVKRILEDCVHCKRFNSRPIKVNTNQYTDWNVNVTQRFFSVCFIDYFGPYITELGNVKTKTYCIIFKCIWSRMVNVEVVTSADSNGFLLSFQNHVYSYGLPSQVFSDSGTNLGGAFSWIKKCLSSPEVKDFFDQRKVKITEFEQYPRGSLNRGIGGIIESGVGLIRKLIQGSIRNNILDFLKFQHVIKQCVCYANKKPISELGALREQNVNDDFQVISPEYLKFGYDTNVLECIYNDNEDNYDENTMNADFKKLIDVKERLRNSYHKYFLTNLQEQATEYKSKYSPVSHTLLHKGDIVLVRDPMVKSPNFPMARVLDVVYNSMGEAIRVKLLKGNRNIIFRDISSVILLIKNAEPVVHAVDPVVPTVPIDPQSCIYNDRVKRNAALVCSEKNKILFDSDLI